MVQQALFKSEKQTWRTPESLLSIIKDFAAIELDPCTASDNPTGAARFYTKKDDGLTQSWACDGLVYVNSPYGRELASWVQKATVENITHGAEILMLLPARPDTRYWHDYVFATANAICFMKGRLRFVGADHSAPFPSALVYWGPNTIDFHDHFSQLGYCNIVYY